MNVLIVALINLFFLVILVWALSNLIRAIAQKLSAIWEYVRWRDGLLVLKRTSRILGTEKEFTFKAAGGTTDTPTWYHYPSGRKVTRNMQAVINEKLRYAEFTGLRRVEEETDAVVS